MERVNQKMKKFNLRGVLDNLRSSVQDRAPKVDSSIEETLRSEHFSVTKTVRYGFPHQPTALAYDPVQNLLAIGTKNGIIRIFGRPGVECDVRHDGGPAILQLIFLVNEGAILSICTDDTINMWSLRQKQPELIHSLQFQREKITCCHLPFQSRWLYIGTERGNVHVVNLESFSLSGYVINWNKAMELIRLAHPGPVVHLSDNPIDANKLLVGFETGTLVLWDLKYKTADCRFTCTETLKTACWHQEGKQFICSHGDGSVTLWNVKNPQRPHSFLMPHSKLGKDGKPEPCKPILKVDYRTVRNSEPYIIFSGGTSVVNPTPSVTVMHGNSMTVLEMEHPVVDFISLCSTPWNSDFQDPHAIAVLLHNDLVVVDLHTTGYPCFENPYPMDIHESPVTCCQYFADCPPDLIPAYYSVGAKSKPAGYSDKKWPIHGGEWGAASCSYPEIVITGHADGSIKFWDASSVTLQVLYKLKTSKIFDESRCRPSASSLEEVDECPFAVQHIYLCVESRLLCMAGSSHVVLFRFNKQEVTLECPSLEISIVYEIYDALDSPDMLEFPVIPSRQNLSQVAQQSSYSNQPSNGKEPVTSLRIRSGSRKWPPGYQPTISCLVTWNDNEPPPPITSLCINSRFKLLAFGNECGIAIVDIVQKTCLLSMGTPDLYGSMDPYSRAPRSPKLKQLGGKNSELGTMPVGSSGSSGSAGVGGLEECRSPTAEQTTVSSSAPLSSLVCTSQSVCLSRSSSSSLTSPTPTPTSTPTTGFLSPESSVPLTHVPKHLEAIKELSQISESDDSDLDPISRLRASSTSEAKSKKCKNSADLALSSNFPCGELKCKELRKKRCMQNSMLSASLDFRALQAVRCEKLSSICSDVASLPSSDVTSLPSKQTLKKTSSGGGGRLLQRLSNRKKRDAFARSHSLSIEDPAAPPTPALLNPPSLFNTTSTSSSSPLGSLSDSPTPGSSVCAPARTKHCSSTDTGLRSLTSESRVDSNGTSVSSVPPLPLDFLSESDSDLPPARASDKPAGGFVRMMSRRLKSSIGRGAKSDDDDVEGGVSKKRLPRPEVINLSSDDPLAPPTLLQLDHASYCQFDRVDNSFSRSHSSSMTSLENVSKEAIESLYFTDVFTRKTDVSTSPCLWVGTSLGTVLVISLTLPPDGEPRRREPAMLSPSGTIFRLKGSILAMSFLDGNGIPLPPPSHPWKDGCKVAPDDSRKDKSGQQTVTNNKAGMSPTTSTDGQSSSGSQSVDQQQQYAVICSEKQARVIALPTQTCLFKVKITETSVVAKAEIISLREGPCLACFVANGHIMTFSLPCLRPLLDIDYIPFPDVRVARTICFTTNANVIYMCSPSELQKLCLSAEANEIIKEMQGDLFVPCNMPEAPKLGFFKNLFSAGSVTSNSSVEREELFGESSGKASKGLAKYTAGPAGSQEAASQAACSEIGRAKMLALERGERLGELDEKTEQMKREAEQFSLSSQQLKNKYKDKKWYQL